MRSVVFSRKGFHVKIGDVGDCSVWQINAPNSTLRVLEIYYSYLKRLEVLCLPKLEKLHWEMWVHYEPPLCLGSVPSLVELCQIGRASCRERVCLYV